MKLTHYNALNKCKSHEERNGQRMRRRKKRRRKRGRRKKKRRRLFLFYLTLSGAEVESLFMSWQRR